MLRQGGKTSAMTAGGRKTVSTTWEDGTEMVRMPLFYLVAGRRVAGTSSTATGIQNFYPSLMMASPPPPNTQVEEYDAKTDELLGEGRRYIVPMKLTDEGPLSILSFL